MRIIFVDHGVDHRELLGEELSGEDTVVQSLPDEQILLDAPEAARHADLIILGPTRSIASVLSLSVRLHEAGIRVPIVNLMDARRQADANASHQAAGRVGRGLHIDDMLKDLGHLVESIARDSGRPSGRLVQGTLVLEPSRVTRWKDIEVPLTSREFEIVRLLARHPGEFVSHDAIYALVHGGPAAMLADDQERRTRVQMAVRRIGRKFRDCDAAFSEIEGSPEFGYRWGQTVRAMAPSGNVINWPRRPQ
jgi:DNA-binding response OmpR family regulator